LDDPRATGSAIHKGVQEIKKASQRAASLTRQLLAFSRQQALTPKVLDVNAVVVDVEAMLRRLIGEDIDLLTTLDEHLGPVLADRGQLEQVIINLAANARDAMPNGGKLVIQTSNVELRESDTRRSPEVPPGQFIQLVVSDFGIGMDAETQADIFEPFFTTKEVGQGTGLGLSMVYGIVKQSNGFVRVSSDLGKGTKFELYLPQAEGQVPAQVLESDQPGITHKGKTILLAEDEESLRAVTRDLLLQSEYNVLEAENGTRALEIAQQHGGPIDLLLTDVIMPGMNGPALAEKLVRTHLETKMLYMSGYTDHKLAQHGLESGIHLLEKPFTRDSLMGRVREVLEAATRGLPSRSAKSRRSQRLSIQIRIRIRIERQSQGETPFCEETKTITVNVHGALIKLQAKPKLRETLRVQNTSTNEIQEAVVVFLSEAKDGSSHVGLEFTKPNPSFWHVIFPPQDWTPGHPDAKAHQEWDWIEPLGANWQDSM